MKQIFITLIIIGVLQSIGLSQNLENLKKQKPFVVNGSMMTSLNYNASSNINQTYQPLSTLLSINLNPKVYGFSMPFSFTYSQMNKSFSHPFARIGISPTYKWMKFDLGHRSTKFSRYTVNGQKSFGAGFMLTPRKFRLGFMYGKFRRDRGFRTVNEGVFEQDDYGRLGYVGKIGVGSKKNFVDLVFMKIADDKDDFKIDSNRTVLPESNIVSSVISKFSIGKHIKIHAEVAASLFTRNLESDTFDFGEDIKPILRKAANYSQINSSSYLSWAKDMGIDFKFKKITMGLVYKRIDPGYKSIGARYIRNDFENYSIKTGLRLKKAFFNASVGILKDNLKNTKAKQTDRIVTRINITLTPNKIFKITSTFSNFSTQQSEGRLPLNDTIKLYQVNKNFSLIPQLNFVGKGAIQTIVANYTFANMLDKNEFANEAVPVISNIAFVQYGYRKTKGGWGASVNLNYVNFKTTFSEITNIGPTISFDKQFFNNKMTTNLSTTYLSSDNSGVRGNVYSFRGGINYSITKKQHLVFNFFYTLGKYPDDSQIQDYNNSRGSISYTYHL